MEKEYSYTRIRPVTIICNTPKALPNPYFIQWNKFMLQ